MIVFRVLGALILSPLILVALVAICVLCAATEKAAEEQGYYPWLS